MSVPRLRGGALAGFGICFALAAIGPAQADVRTIQVKVEVRFIEVDRNTFREIGGAIAARNPCKEDREVSIFYKATETSSPQKLGEVETNAKGAFSLQLASPAVSGLYSATVKKEIEKEHSGDDLLKFICKPGSFPYTHF